MIIWGRVVHIIAVLPEIASQRHINSISHFETINFVITVLPKYISLLN